MPRHQSLTRPPIMVQAVRRVLIEIGQILGAYRTRVA
jgi:hypothetical protein